MGLNEVLRALQRGWAVIVALTALGLAAAAVALLLVPSSYSSDARLFVSTQSLGSADELLQGSTYTQTRMLSYAQVASDPIVLDPVIERLGLDVTASELADDVTATAERDSLIIDITARDGSPEGSAALVNEVATELSRVITEEIEKPIAGSRSVVSVTAIKTAQPPTNAAWPSTTLFLVVGGAAGLLLGLGLALLRGALDTRVRSADDARSLVHVPVLGMVVKSRHVARESVHAEMAGRNQFAEAVRAIRTNLEFVDAEGTPRHTLLFTSSIPGEGKSTLAAGHALALAEAGKRVALIDADLRRPMVADTLGLEGGVGLTDVLRNRIEIDEALQEGDETGNLLVLTSGRIPPNPSELLGSDAFAALVLKVSEIVDYVVIDSPPVLAVTDAVAMSRSVDGVVVVVGVERVRRAQVSSTLLALEQVGAPVVGVVINRLPRRGVDATGYYSYGYYGPEVEEKDNAGDEDHRPRAQADEPSLTENESDSAFSPFEELSALDGSDVEVHTERRRRRATGAQAKP